eukprot:scaffold322387_cov19-Prasinocladus_malaysianus.AAC.1
MATRTRAINSRRSVPGHSSYSYSSSYPSMNVSTFYGVYEYSYTIFTSCLRTVYTIITLPYRTSG